MLIDLALLTRDNQNLIYKDDCKLLENFASLLEDSKDFI